jgi:hypothetical protein
MHAAEQRHDDDLERDDSVEHDVRRGDLDAGAVDPALLGKGLVFADDLQRGSDLRAFDHLQRRPCLI